MTEVTWPTELLIGSIKWTPPYQVIRQRSVWTGRTREVEMGPAGPWRASVPVHLRHSDTEKGRFRVFDGLMRQAGAWTRLAAAAFPQAATDPVVTLANAVAAGARSATLHCAVSSVELARAGQLMTIQSADGQQDQLVTLLNDIDIDGAGNCAIAWTEALRFPSGTTVEVCNPFVRMRYERPPDFTDLPGQFFEIATLELEEAY